MQDIQLGGKIWLPEEYLIKIKTVGKIYEVTSARIIFSLCPIEIYDVEAYYPRYVNIQVFSLESTCVPHALSKRYHCHHAFLLYKPQRRDCIEQN